MNKLKSMQVFVSLVESGSFTKAGQLHQISSTMVGKHIKALESDLSTQLMIRTTRKKSLTETGQHYYQMCKRILDDLENTENQIQNMEQRPSGRLIINAPVSFANYQLAPVLSEFMALYPEINLELQVENQLIDPWQNECNLVIRIGELSDSSLYARYLGDYPLIYAAAPGYLTRKGTPQRLADLTSHQCLGFLYQDRRNAFPASIPGYRLLSNSGEVLLAAARQGAGVILQPRVLLEQDIQQGRLVEVLQKERRKAEPVHLIYKKKPMALKLKVFADFLASHLSGDK
ncbi:LysR substrate-binding domain-containing protein [Spongorhabdus nitratireducens]